MPYHNAPYPLRDPRGTPARLLRLNQPWHKSGLFPEPLIKHTDAKERKLKDIVQGSTGTCISAAGHWW